MLTTSLVEPCYFVLHFQERHCNYFLKWFIFRLFHCVFLQISVPNDFKLWYETMCSQIPTRFTRLFQGPMWSGVPKELQKDPLTVSKVL